MILAGCEAFGYELPLTTPLRIGGHYVRTRRGLLIRLRDRDGHCGYGEVAPLPGLHREDWALVLRQLKVFRACVLNGTLTVPERDWLEARYWEVPTLCPSLRHGVEWAVFDLLACRQGKTLPAWLNPDCRHRIAVNGLLPREGDVAVQARQLVSQGYTALKLKVGWESVARDVARVRAVREACGDAVALRVDANRAWDFPTAARFGEQVADCRLDYVEEPLREAGRLAALHRATGMPLALDESLVGDPLESSVIPEGVVAFVLKPAVLGGVKHLLRLKERAEGLGIRPVISSVFESGVGLAHLAACAAALIAADVPVGLDTYRWLATDIVPKKFAAPAGIIGVEDACRQARNPCLDRLNQLA